MSLLFCFGFFIIISFLSLLFCFVSGCFPFFLVVIVLFWVYLFFLSLFCFGFVFCLCGFFVVFS